MIKKFISIVASVLLFSIPLFAENTEIKESAWTISVTWNNKVNPGDAIFVRAKFEGVKGKKKIATISARADLMQESKRIEKAEFYQLSGKKKLSSGNEILTGLPISTWAEAGEYQINVVYKVDENSEMLFTLPVEILEKEFLKETIPLNDSLTNLRTDTSAKKIEQSKKLNDLLAVIDSNGVYTLSKFNPPVASKRRTSEFGERRIFKYPSGKESTSMHAGIDFGVPAGTEVRACGDGKVVMAEDRITTGYSVIIEHLPGLYSLYYHMNELKVSEGQNVKSGDLIGLSGARGFATGPHLHWEIRLDTVAVSPDFFTGDFAFQNPSE